VEAGLPARPEASPQIGPNASVPGENQVEDLGPTVDAQQASLSGAFDAASQSPAAKHVAGPPLDRPSSPPIGGHMASKHAGAQAVVDGFMPCTLDEPPPPLPVGPL
jgi:hypothetical protein